MIGINILSDPVPSVHTHECCLKAHALAPGPASLVKIHFHKGAIIYICLITIYEIIKGVAYSDEHMGSLSDVCQEIVLAATQNR